MQKSILFLLFLYMPLIGIAQQTNTKLLASCCETKVGKCTGSASCTACKNCSRCAYCSNGGSCGVCRKSAEIQTFVPKTSTKNSSLHIITTEKTTISNHLFYAANTALNLRKEPVATSAVVEVVKRNGRLIHLATMKDWVKVRVEESGNVGYVPKKFLIN